MRRKRRNRSTWFPILPFSDAEGTFQTNNASYDARLFGVLTHGTPNVAAIPLIPDVSTDPADSVATDNTLRDFVEGQTCIIERIVGKIVWWMGQNTPPADPNIAVTNCVACTAFAVLGTANDAGTSPELPSTEWDPLAAENAHKPWLWRRTWVLADNKVQTNLTHSEITLPSCNEFFASAYDGPHIDTKGTKRAIRRNERIFMIHSVRGFGDPDANLAGDAGVIADLRVLGRMTKSRNRGQFT